MLENDVKYIQGKYEGVYTFQGFSDGMDYWVDADGQNVLWYKVEDSTDHWLFGPLHYLSTTFAKMYGSSTTLEKKCPNNEGYVWNWNYTPDDSSFIATNDVHIKCANEDDFCTSGNPCGTDQGDCDTHDECQDGLFCGSNNCPDSIGFHSEFDCCYVPTVGDVNCGDHYATFCHECPNGNGASWCNGDCEWNPTSNECQIKGTSYVSCGGHFATTCEDCPSGNGASWCNGDCEWNSTSNECHIKGTIGCNK